MLPFAEHHAHLGRLWKIWLTAWANVKGRNITRTLFLCSFPSFAASILSSFFRLSPLKQKFSSLTHPRAVCSPDLSFQERELEFYTLVRIGNPNLLQESPLTACISGLPFEGGWLCRCCQADVSPGLAVEQPSGSGYCGAKAGLASPAVRQARAHGTTQFPWQCGQEEPGISIHLPNQGKWPENAQVDVPLLYAPLAESQKH